MAYFITDNPLTGYDPAKFFLSLNSYIELILYMSLFTPHFI